MAGMCCLRLPAFSVPLALALSCAAPAPQAQQPEDGRQRELVRMVRQDCGSCHGLRLTGGLGPPLTPDALGDKPVQSLAAAIFHGRPGTPMPPWRRLLSEPEAQWIAERLVTGFPQEPR